MDYNFRLIHLPERHGKCTIIPFAHPIFPPSPAIEKSVCGQISAVLQFRSFTRRFPWQKTKNHQVKRLLWQAES
jgi:hypothetical protein